MGIKKIKRNIKTYLVTFSYKTYKGYYKEQQRLVNGFSKEDVKECFAEWSKDIRTMTNAEILGIDQLKEYTEEVEI